jgi:hypothetical protein
MVSRHACPCSGVCVATGPSLRLYSRGGLLEADVPYTALLDATASASSAAAAPSRSAPAHAIRAVLPLESYDMLGLAATPRIVVGGNLGALQLIDASRMWGGGAGGGYGAGRAVKSAVRSVASFRVSHSVGHLSMVEGRALAAGSRDTGEVTLFRR